MSQCDLTIGAGWSERHINDLPTGRRIAPRRNPCGIPTPTGALHHVALNCSGYQETVARFDARGLEYRVNHVAAIGLRQVFTLDPNGVLFELNFFAD